MTLYRLWDVTNNEIAAKGNNLEGLLQYIIVPETVAHATPFREGHTFQILMRNRVTENYDLLYTMVRGSAYNP